MSKPAGKDIVIALHDEQIAEHGGQAGLRDEGLLESALARPVNRANYGEGGVADLAAAYGYHVRPPQWRFFFL